MPRTITVFLGGNSKEREVSLRTGVAVARALRSLGHTVLELDPGSADWELPTATEVVFLALHGTYGEDGTVQRRLEELGVPYTGCDPESSRVAFDKLLTKERCLEAGIATPRYLVLDSLRAPWPKDHQPPFVLKPVCQGSSVGLQFVDTPDQWPAALAQVLEHDSRVLVEERILGRETTVGILAGQALPIVEVRPRQGAYDYQNKYTAGVIWGPARAVMVDHPLHDVAERDRIRAGTGAHLVEMEGAAWAGIAAARGVPFAAVRVVSDHANRPLPGPKPLGGGRRAWLLRDDGTPRKHRLAWAFLVSGAWRRPQHHLSEIQAAGGQFREAMRALDGVAEALFPALQSSGTNT